MEGEGDGSREVGHSVREMWRNCAHTLSVQLTAPPLTELARHSYLGIMARQKNDILQGTLVLLVLKTIDAQGRMHGYAITSHIQRVSSDLLRVEEGSLYPALHRMEQDGWLKAEWGTTEKNREAKFYTITTAGRKQLAIEQESWTRLRTGVTRVLRYA